MERDYNYLFGLLKSRERELLAVDAVSELLAARDLPEVIALLPQMPFATALAADPSDVGIEAGAVAEADSLRETLAAFAPTQRALQLYTAPLDLFNLRVAVMGHLTGASAPSLFGPPGILGEEALTAASELSFSGTPSTYQRVVGRALAAYYGGGRKTLAFELAFDRATRQLIVTLSVDESADVHGLALREAEVKVAEIMVRGHAASLPWELIRWGTTGLATAAELEELYAAPQREWASRRFFNAPWFSDATNRYGEEASVARVVQEAMGGVESAAAAWRHRPAGLEYLSYFLRRKALDVANLRLIAMGKLHGLVDAALRERVVSADL